MRLRDPLLAALAEGMAAGVLAYVGGRWVAAAGSGLGGFLAALAAQAGLWLRRVLAAPGLPPLGRPAREPGPAADV